MDIMSDLLIIELVIVGGVLISVCAYEGATRVIDKIKNRGNRGN